MIIPSEFLRFDRERFAVYLEVERNLRRTTIMTTLSWATRFVKSQRSPAEFVNLYSNIYSRSNAAKGIRYVYRYLNLPVPNITVPQISPDRLILPVNKWEVVTLPYKIDSLEVATYIVSCFSNALRPQRQLALLWEEIDLENRIIKVNENIRTKHYRPQIIHDQLAAMLKKLPRDNERVFNFGYKKVRLALDRAGTKLRPNNGRDFFYQEALRAGMNEVIIEWLLGHDIGIRKHYLADRIAEEYQKFQRAVRFKEIRNCR